MYKHPVGWLTLALTALLQVSSARAIWPFSSAATQQGEALISDKHAAILEKAGYAEFANLASHPLWKIHKYEGIDLKPVRLESQVIASPAEQQLLDARNPVSSEQPVDLSFLDDLGGLAYFLPEPEDQDGKANALADSIVSEEQRHPGFFSKLWARISAMGSYFRADEQTDEEPRVDDAFLRIALPETKQHYAEVNVIRPTSTNRAIQRQPTDQLVGAVSKPVAKWYKPNKQFSHSQAWVQSWSPNAAYSVHVQGPSEYPAEHVALVESYTADANNQFQRKVSQQEEEEEEAVTEGQVQQVAELESTTVVADDAETRSAALQLSRLNLPEGLMRRLQISRQDVEDVLNNKESASRAKDRLRALQKQFDAHKDQLGHIYPNLGKFLPK